MKETTYAYAVGRIRANELSLLTMLDIDQLISADSYRSAITILEEKGWLEHEAHEDLDRSFKAQELKMWHLLQEISPDTSVFDSLLVRNDFHNIKASLKSFVSAQLMGTNIHEEDHFLLPCTIDPNKIHQAIITRNYDDLPAFVSSAILATYEVLIRTADGQLADIMLDAKTMEEMKLRAAQSKSTFIEDVVEILCVSANIKIALRAAKTGKDKLFLETALISMKSLKKDSLIEATLKGNDELIHYLISTPFSGAVEAMKTSSSAFEKWCDDFLMAKLTKAKYVSLAVDPLIAYYIAKTTEIKNIRILLSCKHNHVASESIKERMRKLYV
ncbi:MAG: Archaeal/vacuolar-type H+-ATPase subunit C [Erysipelotrichaceae bacterium]|nr:MAG: Archaeal/vacuolar-type H+-ATPase subunit [Erysipelotrichaceae bacterium]TXT19995.1 MAG: Archaeal/vacuolar-type H+-ATPase subunit C [Erysipelotrichaceae bacterium]